MSARNVCGIGLMDPTFYFLRDQSNRHHTVSVAFVVGAVSLLNRKEVECIRSSYTFQFFFAFPAVVFGYFLISSFMVIVVVVFFFDRISRTHIPGVLYPKFAHFLRFELVLFVVVLAAPFGLSSSDLRHARSVRRSPAPWR